MQTMTFAQLRLAAARVLAAISDVPQLEADVMLANAMQVVRATVIAHPEHRVDAAAVAHFMQLVEDRATGVPLAYLIGRREFFGLDLIVGEDVLVPRPETELLVEEALMSATPPATRFSGGGPGRAAVLDLGTGSGAIALAIKHEHPDWSVTGVDVSPLALRVARANGERLGLDIEWLESDWFTALTGRRFDVMVCNPPYVATDDPHFAGPLRFEPRGALDGGPDGLSAIRRLLQEAPAHMASAAASDDRPGSRLIIEHGFDQQDRVLELAQAEGFTRLAACFDLAGLDRYVVLGRD